jgi:hypothetical protein
MVVLAFLMKLMQISSDEALKMLTPRRFYALPNSYLEQLRHFEKCKGHVELKNKNFLSITARLKSERESYEAQVKHAEVVELADADKVKALENLMEKRQGMTNN